MVSGIHCKWRAGENPIYCVCLVPIYGFPEMKLLFPKQNHNVLSPSSYTHISVRNLYISRIGLASAAGKYVDQSWEYINSSHTYECGNLHWGRAIPRKGIHKWDFLCSVPAGVGKPLTFFYSVDKRMQRLVVSEEIQIINIWQFFESISADGSWKRRKCNYNPRLSQ